MSETKLMSINLLDIVPLVKPTTRTNKEQKGLQEKYAEMVNGLCQLEDTVSKYFDKYKTKELLEKALVDNKLMEKMDKIRMDYLFKHGHLPVQMAKWAISYQTWSNGKYWVKLQSKSDYDPISTIAQCSAVSGLDIKNIADKFGFVVIPYECFNESALELTDYSKRNTIRKFAKMNGEFEIYVVSPLEYYSLENHVKENTEELPIYPGIHSATFNGISISLPMFRSMNQQMKSIQSDNAVMRTNLKTVETSINQMQTTLSRMQQQFDKQQKELIMQKMQLQAQAEEMAKVKAAALRAVDPMMIAFKKGTDITSEEFDEMPCFIGPCWGPDFNESVAIALDFKIIKGQRSLLTKTADQLWN